MQKLSRSLIALGGLAALAACGDDVSITPPTPIPAAVVGVTVSPASLSLKVGESATMGVSVETTGGAGSGVTWTSSTPAVATVSATGAVVAVAAGNTTVRATSTVDNTKSGAAQVTVTAPAVRSVTVSPATVSLQIGQSVTAIATVDRDAGAAGTVTWASSNAAIATVTSAGVIAAVAQGTAVISATSTVDPTKAGALSVSVVPVPNTLIALSVAPTNASLGVGGTIQLVPSATTSGNAAVTYTYATSAASIATVSSSGMVTAVGNGTAIITTTAATSTNSLSVSTTINVASASVSISTITTGGLGTPVNLAAVANQIEVTLNVSAGNQTLDSVRVKLGNASAASQGFTVNGAPNAPVTLSINTAFYTLVDSSTATARYLNGATSVQAELFVRGASGPTASNSINLTLANADAFHQRWSVPTTTAASAATGLIWHKGSITLNVIPVIYTGNTVASANLGLNNCTSSTASPHPVNDTAAPFVATFACAATESNNVTPLVNSSVFASGNAGPTAPNFANGTALVRLDNVAPGAPTFAANPNGRQNGWINGTVGLVGLNTSATDNDWLVNGAADAGVGGYTRMLRFGTDMVTALAATASSAPTLPAPMATNASYCAVASASDALGNESARPASTTICNAPLAPSYQLTGLTHQQFGVDIAAPTIAFSAGLASNARVNAATVGTEFQVTVADTGAIGNSGMLAGTPVAATVTVRNAAGTTGCLAGTVVLTVCTASGTGMTPALPLVATNAVAASATLGYYTFTGYAQDAAGNASGTVTRVAVRDNTAAVATNPSVPVAISGAFTAAAFLNDDLSLRDYYYTVGYAGIFPNTITLAAAPTVVDAYNAPTLTNTNFAVNTPVNTFLGLQDGTAGAPAAYVANANPLNALNLYTRDQTQPAYSLGTSAVAPTAPAAGVSITNFTTYASATSAAIICGGTVACGATPITTNLTAVATGTTAVFNNPFSRVDFYGFNGTDYVLLGSTAAGSATLVDNGVTRVFTYTFALAGTAAYNALTPGSVAATVRDIRAFGVSASGSVALVSAGVAQTINP